MENDSHTEAEIAMLMILRWLWFNKIFNPTVMKIIISEIVLISLLAATAKLADKKNKNAPAIKISRIEFAKPAIRFLSSSTKTGG